MTQQERMCKAKIPGPETGITVRHTLCDICSPAFHCGIDAYVKDGRIIKVEGMDAHPQNRGMLCTKGLCSRQFVYREDRVHTPLRRTGPRGSGRFEAITWEEAYREIARRLLSIRAQYGPESVVFYSGYTKWYRAFLRRLCHSFGSNNYATESSVCMTSAFMAWDLAVGSRTISQFFAAGVFVGWAFSPHYSRYSAIPPVQNRRERGLMKVIIIDPRVTPASEQMADLHLRPRPGTDGALALGLGKVLIDKGWIDQEYIREHVHGFEEYRAYVQQFDLARVEAITGVPAGQILACAHMMTHSGPMAINESAAPLAHHVNGMQNYRAVMALSAITGNYDRAGGQAPVNVTYNNQSPGFDTREHEFIFATQPESCRPMVGEQRFPLWAEMTRQAQACDIPRQIREGTPYPLKALVAFGMNARMFPDSEGYQAALDRLDFVVDVDLFLTESAARADIVLPACSSFERSELKAYSGGYLWYTKPVIDPLYSSKNDAQIICELAEAMDLDDALLRSGYEPCLRWMTANLSVPWEALKAAELPVHIPEAKRYEPGAFTRRGYNTPTGKFELYSTIIEKYKDRGLDPLPTYRDPLPACDRARYPLVLSAGNRIPGAIHSRFHRVPWARSLRPRPAADLHPLDAEERGIRQGDPVRLETPKGAVSVRANLTAKLPRGMVSMFYGYPEADVNSILDGDFLDPYTGFPAYRTACCQVRKEAQDGKMDF